MKLVWGLNFKNFATEGTFEDTFGDSHNTPSPNTMLNLGKNLGEKELKTLKRLGFHFLKNHAKQRQIKTEARHTKKLPKFASGRQSTALIAPHSPVRLGYIMNNYLDLI